jgi:hypothetical protein
MDLGLDRFRFTLTVLKFSEELLLRNDRAPWRFDRVLVQLNLFMREEVNFTQDLRFT